MTLRQSPLAAHHRALDAQMVDFGGWEMPIAYPTGTLAEHLACRSAAAAFDVSHLGSMRVEGDGAFDRLQATLTNDLAKIGPGRAQYTHLLDADDASVLDDIIVWWHPRGDGEPDVFDVMPNASNTDRVVAALGGIDTTDTRAVIAVQGPEARALVEPFFPDAAAVGRFRVSHCTLERRRVCRRRHRLHRRTGPRDCGAGRCSRTTLGRDPRRRRHARRSRCP